MAYSLKFPFNETTKRLNLATYGLILFDNPLLKFVDSEDELQELPNETIMKKFESEIVKKIAMCQSHVKLIWKQR